VRQIECPGSVHVCEQHVFEAPAAQGAADIAVGQDKGADQQGEFGMLIFFAYFDTFVQLDITYLADTQ